MKDLTAPHVSLFVGGWIHSCQADGRCMLDGVSFNRLNPNSRSAEFGLDQDQYNQQTNSFSAIPEEKLFMVGRSKRLYFNDESNHVLLLVSYRTHTTFRQAWPTILGFSFSAKKWGEFSVAELGEVHFDDQAFHKYEASFLPSCTVSFPNSTWVWNALLRLVLPEEKKLLVKSLVENSADFTDIISGKGGGCIFLLHGSPGVGKVQFTPLSDRPRPSWSTDEPQEARSETRRTDIFSSCSCSSLLQSQPLV